MQTPHSQKDRCPGWLAALESTYTTTLPHRRVQSFRRFRGTEASMSTLLRRLQCCAIGRELPAARRRLPAAREKGHAPLTPPSGAWKSVAAARRAPGWRRKALRRQNRARRAVRETLVGLQREETSRLECVWMCLRWLAERICSDYQLPYCARQALILRCAAACQGASRRWHLQDQTRGSQLGTLLTIIHIYFHTQAHTDNYHYSSFTNKHASQRSGRRDRTRQGPSEVPSFATA